MGVKDTIKRIAKRTKALNIDTYLFDTPFTKSEGISLKEDDSQLLKYLEEHNKNRYFIFGLGQHNSWKKVQNPTRTEYNGLITSFVSFLSPSPNLNINLLKSIGINIEEPPKDFYKEQREDLKVDIAPYCIFDFFFPELISIGYGTEFGLQSIIASHANQGEYWVVGSVDIGKNVLVGAKSVIGPGVKIGDYAKINAGSYVYSDVPAGMIANGNPAKVVGKRKIRKVIIEDGIPKIKKEGVIDNE